MSLQSGQVYTLTNAKSGTVLDLSGADNRTIIGYPYHGGSNQKWLLDWTGNSWTFQSVSTGLYLGLNGAPQDGTPLVASSTPVPWYIWPDEEDQTVFRIYVPFSHLNFDLFGDGDPTPGTPVTVWYRWKGVHQTWKFTAV